MSAMDLLRTTDNCAVWRAMVADSWNRHDTKRKKYLTNT